MRPDGLRGPKRGRSAAGLLLVLLSIVSWQAPARSRTPHPAAILEGLATHVADGDTLVVQDDAKAAHRIRLLGIDAPEGGQPYGKVARQVLRDRVVRRRVQVLVQSRDRYGRSVGKVLLDGADLNLELVAEGFAWHYVHYAKDQFPGDAATYARAEREARASRRGLWNLPTPVAPWEWRREHRRP